MVGFTRVNGVVSFGFLVLISVDGLVVKSERMALNLLGEGRFLCSGWECPLARGSLGLSFRAKGRRGNMAIPLRLFHVVVNLVEGEKKERGSGYGIDENAVVQE